MDLVRDNRPVLLQWVSAHCGLQLNERTDTLAKEASNLDQEEVPVDAPTVRRCVFRRLVHEWRVSWPDGWYRKAMEARRPGPIVAVDFHLAWTGQWSRLSQYLHRIGKRLVGNGCCGCTNPVCDGAKCGFCALDANSSEHVFTLLLL
jgi:hypothetical protein